jgi:hypothetical protein
MVVFPEKFSENAASKFIGELKSSMIVQSGHGAAW